MNLSNLLRKILRRPFFHGQDRIFTYFFNRGNLNIGKVTVRPLLGNFKIKCDTATWIGAKIVYNGDYEPSLKEVFKDIIKSDYVVLDIGANIGFHSLYFSELVGENGRVISFEAVPINFHAFNHNIELNNYTNITALNIALGNKNEQINITANVESTNPGAYNLFERQGDVKIDCRIGDEIFIDDHKIDFIKIDVEGYESLVLDGLIKTIAKYRPSIIFEYDKNYHKKTGKPSNYIFKILDQIGYQFSYITANGLETLSNYRKIRSSNILALPNKLS